MQNYRVANTCKNCKHCVKSDVLLLCNREGNIKLPKLPAEPTLQDRQDFVDKKFELSRVSGVSATGVCDKWEARPKYKLVRIKEGARIGQDFHFGCWPDCCPPESEYAGEQYQYVAKNPEMRFVGYWDGQSWICKAPGYGNKDDYGNGAVHVFEKDGVEEIREWSI